LLERREKCVHIDVEDGASGSGHVTRLF